MASLQVWFIEDTPQLTDSRIFMNTATNKGGSAICRIDDGGPDNSIPCPPKTLISLVVLSDSTYVETTVHSRRVDFECHKSGVCTNPRRVEITGLTAGTNYVVGIKSLNVNCASGWLTIGSTHTPN